MKDKISIRPLRYHQQLRMIRLRMKAGLTCEQLDSALGVSKGTVREAERPDPYGECMSGTLHMRSLIMRSCWFFNVQPDHFQKPLSIKQLVKYTIALGVFEPQADGANSTDEVIQSSYIEN